MSLALPHVADVNAQAIAEIEKIMEVCTSESPKSLASGGIKTNAKDWPRPTENKPNFSQNDVVFTVYVMPILSRTLHRRSSAIGVTFFPPSSSKSITS